MIDDEPKRIVLTGGPCGGKTTAMARIRERLESLGYGVLVVPEVATLVIPGSGFEMQNLTQMQLFQFQIEVLELQDQFEASFRRLAKFRRPAVILHDRGLMDVAGFAGEDMFQAILNQRIGGVHSHRDTYDAVIHIRTAAWGAEEYYTLDNNTARTETPQQARDIDDAILNAWTGAPHLRVIENNTGFDEKMNRIVSAVCDVVGLPEPLEVERKFLLNNVPFWPSNMKRVDVDIIQHYLKSGPGRSERVRRRGTVFTHTVKIYRPEDPAGQCVEKERVITPREYYTLLEQADPACRPIRKTRTCFLCKDQYLELDTFHDELEGLVLLEVETRHLKEPLWWLPKWIRIEREVTEEKAYGNHSLALVGMP